MPASRVPKRKRKVSVACDFCRRRKLGCDNAEPKCNKCVQHRKECIYSERQRKERPSNYRILMLEEENARLRQTNSLGYSPDRNGNRREALGSSREHSKLKWHQGQDNLLKDSASTEHKARLFGETARQRQLEAINKSCEKLEFGGVDSRVGWELLSAFWNRQHSSGSVVYRTAFMRDMVSDGPYYAPLLLNAIFSIAIKDVPALVGQCPGPDSCAVGMNFRAHVEAELFRCDTQPLANSKMTTIQTLLLISDALYSWCDERSLAWHHLGSAINMIFDLGLHSIRSSFYRNGSVEDGEIGRRVFWAAYIRDKQQAIYQGRPPRLRKCDSSIPSLFLDEYDELEPFHTFTYSTAPEKLGTHTRSVSCFEWLCRLSVIAESILTSLYSEQSYATDAANLLRSSGSLQAELDQWQTVLPTHLNLTPGSTDNFDILPHSLSLMSMFHTLVILLHRPFVSDGHLQNIVGESATAAFLLCSKAANAIDNILRLYGRHFCFTSCPYFLSYATYVAGTIHVRVAAQSTAGSNAHVALRNCLDILQQQQERCHAPRQSMKILLGVVNRLRVDPGREYKARKSRSEDDRGNDDCSTPARRSGGVLADDFSTHDIPSVNSVDFGDLDIDAVIQSFEPTHFPSELPQSSASSQVWPNGAYPRSLDDDFTDGYEGLFDPLFGIDALPSHSGWPISYA